MNWISTFDLVFSLLSVSRWSAPSHPVDLFEVKVEGTSAFYKGVITHQGAKQLIREMETHHIAKLTINSEGGDSPSSIAIGRLVKKSAVSVEVLENCSSACAHFILAAATEVSLKGDPIIALHTSSTGLINTLSAAGVDYRGSVLNRLSEEEVQFLRQTGNRLNLAMVTRLLGPVCAIVDTGKSLSKPERYGARYVFRGLRVTPVQLRALGYRIKVDGVSLPSSSKQPVFSDGFNYMPTADLSRSPRSSVAVPLC